MRLVLVAGEASGDLLGGDLIKALRRRWPHAQFAGIGGPRMAAQGMRCWYPSDQLAVMGLAEVLRHLRRLLSVRRDVARRAQAWPADAFIGIDAPDFNFGLERKLKRTGIPAIHYVSPSIWAWRRKRARKIAHSTDLLLSLFPFEPPLYAPYGLKAQFVGHPLADQLPLQPDRGAARSALQLPAQATVVALLPGSRGTELARLGPIFAQTAARLHQRDPALRFVSPQTNAANTALFRHLCGDLPITFCHDSIAAMNAADLVLLASGTAALEALLCKRPMVVCYRVSGLTYTIVRLFKLLKTQHVSLPNVLAGQALVPELLQYELSSEALAEQAWHLLRDQTSNRAMLEQFERIHRELRTNASEQAAEAITNLLTTAPEQACS